MTPGVTCTVVRTRHIATRDQERAAAEHAEHVYQVLVAHLAARPPHNMARCGQFHLSYRSPGGPRAGTPGTG